jgi:hypothetical protein
VRSRVLVVIVAATLALTGCTAERALPREPTEEEVAAAIEAALDVQWEASGLDGVVDRPDVTAPEPDPAATGLATCVSSLGMESYGWSDDSGLVLDTGERGSDEQQLAFYECFARFPTVTVFSAEQRDVIYDYYARSLVPCLGLHGYALRPVLTRAAFEAEYERGARGWIWSPYYSLVSPPLTVGRNADLVRACPPTVPGIDGWSAQGG